MRSALQGLGKPQLRRWLSAFFLSLAIPAAVLIFQAYDQLKWEAYHQYGVVAGELARRIDQSLVGLIAAEEARAFVDYSFVLVAGDPAANFVQRSPLSVFPPAAQIPGLLGYFQVDDQGQFSSPLMPGVGSKAAAYGIAPDEGRLRQQRVERMRRVLSENQLVQGAAAAPERRPVASPADAGAGGDIRSERQAATLPRQPEADLDAAEREPAVSSQTAFDLLSRQRVGQAKKKEQSPAREHAGGQQVQVADLKLDYRYRAAPKPEAMHETALQDSVVRGDTRGARKELGALPGPWQESRAPATDAAQRAVATPPPLPIRTFESEIDPFEISLLDSGHFVLYRKVWRDGQRYIQGALIEQQPFLRGTVGPAFRDSALADMSELIVAYRGAVFATFSGRGARAYLPSADDLRGAVLHQQRLSAPLGEMELIFSIRHLPAAPGAAVVSALAAIMTLVLCGGFYLMYRLGLRQIELARQQQDFVSAVSHELKTPLTSIRMYGEMLREGWVSEDKKRGYYEYIHDESERLSRLINNVLQLARMNRNESEPNLKPVKVAELVDSIRSKVASQVERAGFTLNVECADAASASSLQVDTDYFSQVIINLVDNALKFSTGARTRVIDIGCALQADGSVAFGVRDYGPGVARDQMKKIFRLFYRTENELTRETLGTGIGLALVHQLVTAMNGSVDVVNRSPGAEFRVLFAKF